MTKTQLLTVPSYALSGPDVRQFAGTDITIEFSTKTSGGVDKPVRIRLSRQHAEALHADLTRMLGLLTGGHKP